MIILKCVWTYNIKWIVELLDYILEYLFLPFSLGKHIIQVAIYFLLFFAFWC